MRPHLNQLGLGYACARALAIGSVSDCLHTGEALDAIDRQVGFDKMITLGLETAKALNEYAIKKG